MQVWELCEAGRPVRLTIEGPEAGPIRARPYTKGRLYGTFCEMEEQDDPVDYIRGDDADIVAFCALTGWVAVTGDTPTEADFTHPTQHLRFLRKVKVTCVDPSRECDDAAKIVASLEADRRAWLECTDDEGPYG